MKYILVVVFGVLLAAWVSRRQAETPKPVTYRALLGTFYSALSESSTDSHPLTDAGPDLLAARALLLTCEPAAARDAGLRFCSITQAAVAETLSARSKAHGNRVSATTSLGRSGSVNSGTFLASSMEPRWRERIAPLRVQAASEWVRIPADLLLPESVQLKGQELLASVHRRLEKTRELVEGSEEIRVLISDVVPGGAVAIPYMTAAGPDHLLGGRKIFLKGVAGVREDDTITILAARKPLAPVMTGRGQLVLEHWIFVRNTLSALQ